MSNQCANCGVDVTTICANSEEGRGFCSEVCRGQYEALGSPHEAHHGYRHPVESARLLAAESALRSLASWLGVGGYNAIEVDARVFERKIRDGVRFSRLTMECRREQAQTNSDRDDGLPAYHMAAAIEGADEPPDLQVGARYRWKGLSEDLIYIGEYRSGDGDWHRFERAGAPGVVWCEVPDERLNHIEPAPADGESSARGALLRAPVQPSNTTSMEAAHA